MQQPLVEPVKARAKKRSTRLTPEEQATRRRLSPLVMASIIDLVGVAVWLMVVPGSFWTAYLLIAIAAAWAFLWALQYRVRRQIGLGLAFFAVLLVCAFYWNFAVEQNQGFSAFLKSSPCGQSSCSHQTNQNTAAYNARGFLPTIFGETNPFSIRLTFCFCETCAWASANGGDIQGYAAINGTHLPDTNSPPIANGGLATTNPDDYGNGAEGLGDGVFPNTGAFARASG